MEHFEAIEDKLATLSTENTTKEDLPHTSNDDTKAFIPPEDGFCYFEIQPDEIMRKIFSTLKLSERIVMTKVCRRWYNLLMDGTAPLEDVVVVNIFQKSVWDKSVKENAGSKISAVLMSGMDDLQTLLSHITSANSVKIWFSDRKFAEEIIDVVAKMGVKMRCLDMYPYRGHIVTDYVFDKLPNTQGITMRPHGSNFFNKPLLLSSFPNFKNLTTLVLDNFTLATELELPSSITTLEFLNRGEGSLQNLIPKLQKLNKLEYLCISHGKLLEESDIHDLLSKINVTQLPNLNYLIFKFCKMHGFSTEMNLSGYKLNLKMLRLEFCYGALQETVMNFTKVSPSLSLLALNVICDVDDVSRVCGLTDFLKSKGIWLHFGVMQKAKLGPEETSRFVNFMAPSSLYDVTSKLEASFIEDKIVVDQLLLGGPLKICQDIRLIQCDAVSNDLLVHFAKEAPKLRKLNILNCENTSENGMRAFIEHMDRRTSRNLTITWKRHRVFARHSAFYWELMGTHRDLLSGKFARLFYKQIPDMRDRGQEMIVWEKDGKKTLVLRDYQENEGCHILGVVIPYEVDDDSTECCSRTTDMKKALCAHMDDNVARLTPREAAYKNRQIKQSRQTKS